MAIVQESIYIPSRKGNGVVEYVSTASDAGFMVQDEDGRLFDSAIDRIDIQKTYTESDIPVSKPIGGDLFIGPDAA